MNKLLLPVLSGIILFITTFSVQAQTQPLSSNLFLQQDKGESETYQCIQIRRGDIITLTGKIEFIEGETDSYQKEMFFTSLGGRTFLLEGEMLLELTVYYNKKLENKNITITGKVLFEGGEEIPAEMEILSFDPSEEYNKT